MKMDDLIEALTILKKHMEETRWPTNCDHDILMVMCQKQDLPEEDVNRLKGLGFNWNDGCECWASFRFGSASTTQGTSP